MTDPVEAQGMPVDVERVMRSAEHWAHMAEIDHSDAAEKAQVDLRKLIYSYGDARAAEKRERCIEAVMRELDSNGQAHAIAAAIRATTQEGKQP